MLMIALTSLSLVDAAAERETLRLVDGLGGLVVLLGLLCGDPEELAVPLVGGFWKKDRPSFKRLLGDQRKCSSCSDAVHRFPLRPGNVSRQCVITF
jgi:hypothetical protein